MGIEVSGYFPDPSAPAGFSSFSGRLPLSDFASTASLNALQNQIGANMAMLNSQLKHYAAQGVAQALAMAGVGDIDADQKVSISMNFGTYEGQSAAAMGIAVRLDHHVSFNAGMSGMGSGTYGARAGFRIGW
ncbi:MAG TPA: YadA C-terminal domain-containing protein [Rhizomicrobium sp.]|nr:YadA C-terminal domain-containing protein [Rhizomicrobium sp.]